MSSWRQVKGYFPICFVLIVGTGLSVLAQNYVRHEASNERNLAFATLTQSFSEQLQAEKNRHILALNLLAKALSGTAEPITQERFAQLATGVLQDVPAIEGIFLISPSESSQPLWQDKDLKQKAWYSVGQERNNSPRIINNYRTLKSAHLENAGRQAVLMVAEINPDTAFATVLADRLPNWLELYIYFDTEDNSLTPFYAYPPRDQPDFPTQQEASHLPHAMFHSQAIKADRNTLSIFYLPKDTVFFDASFIIRWGTFSAGMTLTLIAGIYLNTINRRKDLISALVNQRTQELEQSAESLRQESLMRQQVVDKLAASQKQLLAVMNSVDGMFWERDIGATRMNFVSEQVEKLMGFTREQVMYGDNILFNSLLPEYQEKLKAAISEFQEGQESMQLEMETRRADGRIIWVRLIYTVDFIDHQPTKIRGVTMDVTRFKKMGEERARLMDSITQSQRNLTSLIDSIDGVLWKFSLNPPRYTYVSKQIEKFFGCTAQQILDNPYYIKERILEEDLPRVREQNAQLMNSDARSQSIEFRVRRDDGKTIYLRNIVTPVFEKGKINRFHGVMLDISHEKEMQQEHDLLAEQLKQAQKLESIGQLAAGIAHEINTPVQFVGDNVRYLKDCFSDLQQLYEMYSTVLQSLEQAEQYPEQTQSIRKYEQEIDIEYLFEDIPASIDQSLDGTTRIRDIVKAMKEFSHPGSASKEYTDLNHAIESTLTVARNEWKYLAEVETELDPDLPPVMLLTGEFNQVMLNIIVNAAHAIDEKRKKTNSEALGKIKIKTQRDGDSILISIKDSGNGIPDEIKSRVFDPFFTTKEVGKGTGQGLAIAYSVIVDKHQGSIRLESEAGVGTTFYINIPIEVFSAPESDPLNEVRAANG